jgi:hypothetical protein
MCGTHESSIAAERDHQIRFDGFALAGSHADEGGCL